MKTDAVSPDRPIASIGFKRLPDDLPMYGIQEDHLDRYEHREFR